MKHLIDKDIVLAEIDRIENGLMDAQGNFANREDEGAYHILCSLDNFINSLEGIEIGVDVGSPEGDLGIKTVQVIDVDGNITEATINKAQKEEIVMTDKVQKIKEWIQTHKLCTMDEHMKFYCKEAECDYSILCSIEKILDSMQEEPKSDDYNPYKVTIESISEMCAKYGAFTDDRANDFANNIKVKCKDAIEFEVLHQKSASSVWHDANILPSNPKAAIVEHNEYSTSICRAEQMSRIKGAKWAYVEDLLKL